MKFVKIVAMMSIVSGLGHASAQVQQNIDFSLSVVASCSIQNIVNASWGNIDGNFLAAADSSNGSITVLCTTGSPFSIGLDNGQNFNGTSRQMTNGHSNFIAYEV